MTGRATRRDIVKGAGTILMGSIVGRQHAKATEALEHTLPKSAGFLSDLDARFDKLQSAGRLSGVHGVVALRGGTIIFERYIAGIDVNRILGPVGKVDFGPETLHDMRSVTKSIVGLLYGIALGKGHVPDVDQSLLAQFPEYSDLARDADRSQRTIAHALTMTLALEWNENTPYTDTSNSEIAMERSSDRYRFILERPVLGKPGTGYIYSGGATALLGALIERGTGLDLPAFAKAALFDPLGIGVTEWARGGDGIASAASGARLTPRDLARIGQMVLDGGKKDGRVIVPADWLDASFRNEAIVDDGRYYGYHWYSGEFALSGRTGTYGAKWVGAFGLGGQRLFVFPALDFVLVVTAGNYATEDQWKPPIEILRHVFLAGLQA